MSSIQLLSLTDVQTEVVCRAEAGNFQKTAVLKTSAAGVSGRRWWVFQAQSFTSIRHASNMYVCAYLRDTRYHVVRFFRPSIICPRVNSCTQTTLEQSSSRVLTDLKVVWLRRSYENRYFPVNILLCPIAPIYWHGWPERISGNSHYSIEKEKSISVLCIFFISGAIKPVAPHARITYSFSQPLSG